MCEFSLAPVKDNDRDDQPTKKRMTEIFKFISDIANKTFDDRGCQTEEGGININSGEVGFEHGDYDFLHEDQKVLISMKRFNGTEGHASCLWKCFAEDGDLQLFVQELFFKLDLFWNNTDFLFFHTI